MREHYLAKKYPDLYIIFDIDPALGLARAKGRGGEVTHFDERDLAFHKRIRQGFFEFAGSNHNITHVTVDASLPQADVERDVLRILREILH